MGIISLGRHYQSEQPAQEMNNNFAEYTQRDEAEGRERTVDQTALMAAMADRDAHSCESGPGRAYSKLSTDIVEFFKDLKTQGMPEDYAYNLTSMYANALMMTRIVT